MIHTHGASNSVPDQQSWQKTSAQPCLVRSEMHEHSINSLHTNHSASMRVANVSAKQTRSTEPTTPICPTNDGGTNAPPQMRRIKRRCVSAAVSSVLVHAVAEHPRPRALVGSPCEMREDSLLCDHRFRVRHRRRGVCICTFPGLWTHCVSLHVSNVRDRDSRVIEPVIAR